MCITSLGIYGFLVSAYQETAYELKNQESEIAVLQLKKDRYQTLSSDIRTEKESLNKNITDLTSGLSNNVIQYTNAEGQVITTTSSATRKALQSELDRTISRRDTLYSQDIVYSDSVGKLDQQMLRIQTESDVSAEVGPIKYVAQQVNQSVDTVVNWFILLFIFVFDPLAVMLLISANRLIKSKRKPVIVDGWDEDHVHDMALNDMVDNFTDEELDDIFTDANVYDVYVDRHEPAPESDIYNEDPPITKEKPKRVIIKSEIL
tara:strand:+ start:42 stop:827 length:786 start_codon:yes stop_codon:yes gene_type:complete